MNITVNTDASKFDQVTMNLASKLRNPTPMLEEIGVLVERSVKKNFRDGGRPEKWIKSRERKANRNMRKKLESKGKASKAQKTLVDTGNLQTSITHQLISGAVYVGTNVLYAPIHHFGGTINHPGGTPYIVTGAMGEEGAQFIRKDGNYPQGVKFTKPHDIKMPARPFLMLQAEDYKRIDSVMKKHIEAGNVR